MPTASPCVTKVAKTKGQLLGKEWILQQIVLQGEKGRWWHERAPGNRGSAWKTSPVTKNNDIADFDI